MIKNLIFDFGKVLVDYDFAAFFQKYIPDTARCYEFAKVFYNAEMQEVFDREAVPLNELLDNLMEQHPNLAGEIRMFNERYPELVTGEMPGMKELLVQLKAQGFKLYGLTNWCSKVYHTIEQYDIFRLLDGYVISSEEHKVKPEPEIYHCLLSRFGLQPAECIFTDDKPENIEGAKRVGMQGIVFENAQQFERDLSLLLAEDAQNDMSWEVINSEYLYRKPWLTARRDHVKLPTGAEIHDFYVLEYPDFCNVIAITKDGKFLMERQYRHAQRLTAFEIPAGCVEKGEDPMEAAKRELYEETGFGGGKWQHFMTVSPNAGACTNTSYTYLAFGVERLSTQHLENSEDIQVVLLEEDEVVRMLQNDEFHQALMAAPLWKYVAMKGLLEKYPSQE